MRGWVWFAVIGLAACSAAGDDDSLLADAAAPIDAGAPDAGRPDAQPPDLAHQQFVMNEIIIPTSATQAQQLALDLDGDPQGRPDNALGLVLSVLASQGGTDLQERTDDAIAAGEIIHLLDVDAVAPEVRVFLGIDGDVPPDPSDNFAGDEEMAVDPTAPLHPPMTATLSGGDLTAGPGAVTIALALGATGTVRLPLVGARITAVVESGAISQGRLGGAISPEDLDAIVLPAIIETMQAQIAADCMGTPPACCDEGTEGETLVDLFDDCSVGSTTCDCAVSADELRDNDLISSLFAPDVDLFDAKGDFNPRVDGIKDSLSLGIGFAAVGVRFDLPD